ncbi:hypothetical protein [Sphingomonas montanisoli]|uniref:Uncharacterized protein n=1 Tax=Sphingomonas montanisoli TaxID=2606412 RepID=A0A5D9C1H2_9SPHN|nr:hypothetical protein [Sphingomonas montanisoli]TZG25574.1 hypothetical protein FYJ91_11135 [Sphingomonas montanisoli]
MSLDPAHSAALDQPVIRPFRFALLDFADGPMRLTDFPYGVTFSGTGDEDLDGHAYSPVDNQPINVSDVQMNERGAETVTFTLSGLISLDSEIMNVIGDVTKWRGRVVRLWRAMFSPTLAMYGRPDPYFTGYMSVPSFTFGRESSTISLSAETYLASLTQASGRSYLSQAEFDSGDLSAEASVAIANGTETNNLAASVMGLNLPTGGLWNAFQ